VKFIRVESDFPLQNRPIYPLNIAYLNYNNLQLQEVKTKIAMAIDNLMTLHISAKAYLNIELFHLRTVRKIENSNQRYGIVVYQSINECLHSRSCFVLNHKV
jgi:hypothetical protein